MIEVDPLAFDERPLGDNEYVLKPWWEILGGDDGDGNDSDSNEEFEWTNGKGSSGGARPDGLPSPAWHPGLFSAAILRKNKFQFLLRKNGMLLMGTTPCGMIPGLLISGLSRENKNHYACMVFRLNGRIVQLYGVDLYAYSFLNVPLKEGTYTLTARWQEGHYDYSKLNKVRIFLFGVDLGFVKLPLLKYTTVAVITKTATELTVNNLKGSYRGNDKFVENNQ